VNLNFGMPVAESQLDSPQMPGPDPLPLGGHGNDTSTKTPSESAGLEVHDVVVIPPSHEARTLVLCFDETGNQFGLDNSNVAALFSMLRKDDRSQQLVYYQAGIGTNTIPNVATPFWAQVDKILDGAYAKHMDAYIMGGYEFLMENYNEGDKICIFGFSRGAYTAQALAGMVHKVGLLPASDHQQIPFAYKMFSRDDKTGWAQSIEFKKAFSVNVKIEFVGVWDTVCSVGLRQHTPPFTASNTAIRYFRHAISLDEHRVKFMANYYHLRHEDDQKGTELGEVPLSNQRHSHPQNEEEYDSRSTETDVREVWFAGCHRDVGGGSVVHGTRNSLARIPLRWMIRQCFLANIGIQFYRESLKDIGLDFNTLYPFVTPRPAALKAEESVVSQLKASAHNAEPTDVTLTDEVQASPSAASTFKSEEDEELVDALCPIYDELKLSKAWWILEILPMRYRTQTRSNKRKSHWRMNLGRPREIPRAVEKRLCTLLCEDKDGSRRSGRWEVRAQSKI